MTGDGRLHFAVLGSFRVDRDGQEVNLGPRLQRALLAILVVDAGHVVPVDRLIDLLWGETPPAAAIASLQAYVSQLRRILEPDRPARAPAQVLVTQDPGYLLRVDVAQVDGSRFLDLAGQAPAAARGPGPEAASRPGPGPGPVARSGAGRVPGRRRVGSGHRRPPGRGPGPALEDRVDAWLRLGHHARAAPDIEVLVAARPLRERRWAQLIVATYRSGRQADALRAYQRAAGCWPMSWASSRAPGCGGWRARCWPRIPALICCRPRRLWWHRLTPRAATPRRAPPSPAAEPDQRHLLACHRAQLDRLMAGSDRTANRRRRDGGAGGRARRRQDRPWRSGAQSGRSGRDGGLWSRCLDSGSAPAFWPWLQLLRVMPTSLAGRGGPAAPGGCRPRRRRGPSGDLPCLPVLLAARAPRAEPGRCSWLSTTCTVPTYASLNLLRLLAGDLDRLPVVVCATLRDTEPSPVTRPGGRGPGPPPVAPSGWRCRPCAPEEVAQLARRDNGLEPARGGDRGLVERTGGNFFYLRVAAAVGQRAPPPPAHRSRRHRPGPARQCPRRGAAAGGRFRTTAAPSSLSPRSPAGTPMPDLLERADRLDTEQLLLDLEPAWRRAC